MASRTLSLEEVYATAQRRVTYPFETRDGSPFIPLINPHVGYVAMCGQGARDLLPDFVPANRYGLFVGMSRHLTALIVQPDGSGEAFRVNYERTNGGPDPQKATVALDPYVLDMRLRNLVDRSLILNPEQLRDYISNAARREPPEAFTYAQGIYNEASSAGPNDVFLGGQAYSPPKNFINLRALEPGCTLA